MIQRYQQSLPDSEQGKQHNRDRELHCKHLLRILGKQVAVQTLTTADVQRYCDQRSQEKGPGAARCVRRPSRRKWTRCASSGIGPSRSATLPAGPIKGIKLGKATEQLPFRTWDEIERTIGRGGLSAVEQTRFMGLPILDQFRKSAKFWKPSGESRHPFLYPMFVFAAHTGARRSEMMRSGSKISTSRAERL